MPRKGVRKQWTPPAALGGCPRVGYKPSAMADQPAEKPCCARTRARRLERIAAYFVSFPVIKDVPCDECQEILEIRVYSHPAA